jgi:hypothetical protein
VAPGSLRTRLVVGSRRAGLVVGVEGEVAEAERFADVVIVDPRVAGEVGDGPFSRQLRAVARP